MASTQRESSFTTFLIIAVLAGIVLDALNWGEKITPTNSKVSWNPLDLLEAGLDGDLAWPSASWFILGGFVFVLIAGYVLITELWISPRKDTAKFNPQGAAITSMMGFTAAWHKARQIYGPSVTRKNAEAFIALAVYTNASKKVPLYIQLEDSLWVYAPA
ncbi:MAG: hypothetical protein ACTIJ0_12180, partial [Glutamicibacter ardleyensis]